MAPITSTTSDTFTAWQSANGKQLLSEWAQTMSHGDGYAWYYILALA